MFLSYSEKDSRYSEKARVFTLSVQITRAAAQETLIAAREFFALSSLTRPLLLLERPQFQILAFSLGFQPG